MDIVTKCKDCAAEFDVDELVLDEEAGKFQCPQCRSTSFELQVKGE